MSNSSILLVGLPETGKTNYLARLWASLREGKSAVKSTVAPQSIRYVEEALAHLLQGEFAGRTNLDFEDESGTFRVPVTMSATGAQADLVVPDVNGELWRKAVEDSEISQRWFDQMNDAPMAMIFVRALSPLNHMPLDWVVSERIIELLQRQNKGELTEGETLSQADQEAANKIPTQVYLCQLLRFLETTPRAPGEKKRIAILVTAWDGLDPQRRAEGPSRYLELEFPLFFGMLKSCAGLHIEVFAVTIVGGDLTTDEVFKKKFVESSEVYDSGYVMQGTTEHKDITLPLAWLLDS